MTLRRYIRDIPRWINRSLDFHMTPLQDIQGDHELWQATGHDPAWTIKPKRGLMPRGWYMLSIKVAMTQKRSVVKLYADFGKGYNENDSFVLAVKQRQEAKRLCFFPTIPKELRLDPAEQPCSLTVQNFSLVRVPQAFAKTRMLNKLSSAIPEKNLLSLRNDIAELWDNYHLWFQDRSAINSTSDYSSWLEMNERPLDWYPKRGDYCPLISVVVPVYNTRQDLLRSCINSVINQTYANWQLCIADDASTMPHVEQILNEFGKRDSRIQWVVRKENGHICAASNSALDLAGGEFVAFLDHDDELHKDALLSVVKELQSSPDLGIIYTDEDKISDPQNTTSRSSKRYNPHFKSDWNPEQLKSHNYITHLCVYRHSLIKQVGGLRENSGVEGAQDFDLVLRCSSLLTSEQIRHIPKVLYHWRVTEGSTALSAGEKSYTVNAGRKALSDYFSSKRLDVQVDNAAYSNFYVAHYPLKHYPLVSLIIPTRDGLDVLQDCIRSILEKTTYPNYEVLIIDNQSQDQQTIDWLDEIATNSKVRVFKFDYPFNYSSINNFGVGQANGEIVGLINNDIKVISPHWLNEMVSLAIQPQNGCIGSLLYYPDDTIQHAGVIVGLQGCAGHSHKGFPRNSVGYFNRLIVRHNVSAVTGACLVVRKNVWKEVGGLDEELAVAFNDIDFCLRVRQLGYMNVFTPFAELYHYESKTRGLEDTPEKIARFKSEVAYMQAKWGSSLKSDPYYNPNLTYDREDFSLA